MVILSSFPFNYLFRYGGNRGRPSVELILAEYYMACKMTFKLFKTWKNNLHSKVPRTVFTCAMMSY